VAFPTQIGVDFPFRRNRHRRRRHRHIIAVLGDRRGAFDWR
jgi:hypothetical protein